MKIRTALTLKYTGVTAMMFLLCMVLIYCVSEHTRSETFFRNLHGEAVTKAHLFLNNQVKAATMQSIYHNNRKFINEVEVAVYTPDYKMLYHDAVQSDIVKESPQMIHRILDAPDGIEFYVENKYQAIGMTYRFKGKTYVITAAAYDGYGFANLAELRETLAILFVIGLSLLFIIGYILARNTLKPIRHVVEEAEGITASNIHKRLPVRNSCDELGELCTAFNALLNRLEASFNSQKMFVSNVSHELRTPLAALSAELDLALQQERRPEQYRTAIGNALQDADRMKQLTDGLLNLAKADYQQDQIKMEDIRLDELLLDARNAVLRNHPDYHVELIFGEEADDDRMITVKGNVYLLTIAFTNLIDNNCKYSPNHTSLVQISYFGPSAIVRFSDNGSGMSAEDLAHIFTLFYRGSKNSHIKGYGIGMPLARKIIMLHRGTIHVTSREGEGTTYRVDLPHL